MVNSPSKTFLPCKSTNFYTTN